MFSQNNEKLICKRKGKRKEAKGSEKSQKMQKEANKAKNLKKLKDSSGVQARILQ
jgi:hypothetical protein